MKDHLASLVVMCDQQVKPPAVVGFLDQDYHYKLVATKFLTMLNWHRYSVKDQTLYCCVQVSDSATDEYTGINLCSHKLFDKKKT